MNQNGRPWYFWPLIAFVVGLLIGWLVIGWGLWPVTWTNALIQDLRPDLRNQYISMVADSYAQTGNLDQARGRLSGWSDEELARVIADAQEVLVARDADAARNVQSLAAAIGATAGAVPSGQGQPQTQPAPGASSGALGAVSRLRTACTAVFFVFLALAALALLIYLFRRWRSAQVGEDTGRDDAPFDVVESHAAAAAAAEQEKTRWMRPETSTRDDWRPIHGSIDTPAHSWRDEAVDTGPETLGQEPRPETPLRPVGPAPYSPGWTEPVEPPRAAPTPPAAAPVPSLQKLSENVAVYQMGEPDYDEAFDINDPVDGYMGQCGLQLIEPFGRERDQAVALQVWLWDSSDPDTQALVLMSEGAYRDTSLRSEHEGEHGALAVKPGTEFELHSHDLLLRGRVEKVSYAEAEPPRGIFADLHVKLTVYRRS